MATLGLRVQVRHWRALAWLATVGVAAGAGYVLWNIVDRYRHNKYQPRSTTYFANLISAAQGTIKKDTLAVAPWQFYDRLVHSPIHGFPPVKPVEEVKPSEPPPPSKKPIGDVLKLKAVLYAPDDKGRAIVEYKDDSVTSQATKDEIVIGIGGKLAGIYADPPFNATLTSIKPNTAIFEWQGESVELHPVKREDVPAAAKTPGAVTRSTELTDEQKRFLKEHADSKETVNLGNEQYLVGTNDQDEMNKNGDKFLNDVRIMERPGADKKNEVVLNGVRPKGNLATHYGVQNDDVLVSINGNPVKSKTQAIQWVRENPNLDRYDVVIRRKGKEITKTILVPRK